MSLLKLIAYSVILPQGVIILQVFSLRIRQIAPIGQCGIIIGNMSIIYNDTQEKTELQRRIMAELREKQAAKPLNEAGQSLTSFDEPDYSREVSISPAARWVIILIVMVVVAVVLFIAVR